MKRITIIVTALLCLSVPAAWGQHYLGVSFGGNPLSYEVENGSFRRNNSPSFGVEWLNPSLFKDNVSESFKKFKGLGLYLGLQYTKIDMQWEMPNNTVAIAQGNGDIAYCAFRDFSERQNGHLVQLTPTLLFTFPKIVLGIGLSGGLLTGNCTSSGVLRTSLEDATTGVVLGDDIGAHGLGTFSHNQTGEFVKWFFGPNVEFGHYLSNDNIYLGLFGSLSWSPDPKKQPHPIIDGVGTDEMDVNRITYNGVLNSNQITGGCAWSVGVKVGVRLPVDKKDTLTDYSSILAQCQNENDTLKKTNGDLNKELNTFKEMSVERTKTVVDRLVDNYAELCLKSAYDYDYHKFYQNLFRENSFINDYYREECEQYLKVLDLYQDIQRQYDAMMESIAKGYASQLTLGYTQTLDYIKGKRKDIDKFEQEVNDKLKTQLDMTLVNIQFIYQKVVRAKQIMDGWIKNADTPLDVKDLKYMLGIE